MPALSAPQFETAMDSSVESVDLRGSSGETYKVLGNIGSGAFSIANELIAERTRHESVTYANNALDDKADKSREMFLALSKTMNPETGRIEDANSFHNGKFIEDALKDSEDGWTREILDSAPTEQARRVTELQDQPATTRRLVDADIFKNKSIFDYTEQAHAQWVDKRGKLILSNDPELTGKSFIEDTNEAILQAHQRIATNTTRTVNQNNEVRINSSNKLANTGANAVVDFAAGESVNGSKHWAELARVLHLNSSLTDKSKKNATIARLQKSGFNVVDIVKVKGGFNIVFSDRVETTVNGEKVLVPKTTFFSMEDVDIKGSDDLIYKSLSTEDVQKFTDIYLRAALKSKKINNAKLRREQEDVLSFLKGNEGTDREKQQLFDNHEKKVLNSELDRDEQARMMLELNSENVNAEVSKNIALEPPDRRKDFLKTFKDIPKEMTKKYLTEEANNPSSLMSTNEPYQKLVETTVNKFNKTQHTFGHLHKYSAPFRRAYKNRMNSTKDYEKYMALRDSLQSHMQVPAWKAQKFDKEELLQIEAELKPLIKNTSASNSSGVIDWITKNREIRGEREFRDLVDNLKVKGLGEASGIVLSLDVDSDVGRSAMIEMLHNSKNAKSNNEWYNRLIAERDARSSGSGKKFDNEVNSWISVLMSDSKLGRAVMNKYGVVGAEKVNSLVDHIKLAVISSLQSKPDATPEAAARNAFNRLLGDNIIAVGDGSSSLIMTTKEAERHGLTKDSATKLMRDMSNPEQWADKVDYTNNNKVKDIIQKEFDGKGTEEQVKARVKELVKSNVLGTQGAILDRGKIYPVTEDNNGRMSALKGKNGKEVYMPIQEAKNKSDEVVPLTWVESLNNFFKDFTGR